MENQTDTIRDHQTVKKINRFMLRIFLPFLLLAGILYIIFTTQNFPMEHGYVLIPVDAENNIASIHCAGTEIIAPGKIAILGKYPWLYGTVEDQEEKYFAINMQSGKLQRFTGKQKEDFLLFLEKNELPFHHLYYYSDLFPADRDPAKIQARKQLKNNLSKPVISKKFGLF